MVFRCDLEKSMMLEFP